jgi:hypothetical protein
MKASIAMTRWWNPPCGSDPSPKLFTGHWVGTLELKEGLEYPWILTSLTRYVP